MSNTRCLSNYLGLFSELKLLVNDTNRRLIEEDSFVKNNINFFTKSFFILSCVYLESYLKDALMEIVDEMNNRLTISKLPHNLIRWDLNPDKEYKDMEQKCIDLSIGVKKKDLDVHISGNPHKTSTLFLKFGINLKSIPDFNNQQEMIMSIVTKRNNIAHHNDNASDVAPEDLINNIDYIIAYIQVLDCSVCNHLNPSAVVHP